MLPHTCRVLAQKYTIFLSSSSIYSFISFRNDPHPNTLAQVLCESLCVADLCPLFFAYTDYVIKSRILSLRSACSFITISALTIVRFIIFCGIINHNWYYSFSLTAHKLDIYMSIVSRPLQGNKLDNDFYYNYITLILPSYILSFCFL